MSMRVLLVLTPAEKLGKKVFYVPPAGDINEASRREKIRSETGFHYCRVMFFFVVSKN